MKVLTTAIVAEIRNKLNGTVFSKNRYGAYARTKVTPVNPQTSYQQDARQTLGNLSSGWRGLSEAQRQGWIDAAPNFPTTDIFGNQQILSGSALYVKLNANLLLAGQATIAAAPSPVAVPPLILESLVSDVSSTTVTISCSEATVPAGFSLAVYATPLITPGRNFVKNRYRFIGLATLVANDANVYTEWNARFGLLTAGQKVFVKVALISNTTGQAGVPSSAVAIVTA